MGRGCVTRVGIPEIIGFGFGIPVCYLALLLSRVHAFPET